MPLNRIFLMPPDDVSRFFLFVILCLSFFDCLLGELCAWLSERFHSLSPHLSPPTLSPCACTEVSVLVPLRVGQGVYLIDCTTSSLSVCVPHLKQNQSRNAALVFLFSPLFLRIPAVVTTVTTTESLCTAFFYTNHDNRHR